MSDDLVKRLRERAGKYDEYDWHGDIELEAASRIEELERANSDLANEFTAAASFLRQGANRIEKLEAALREPTLPMLLAGKKSLYSCSEDPEIEDARACFLAMARKALEGKDD
jgi:hypothetical protein